MHQPRFLARGLLVSFLLIALLAAPGALTFTWAGAAAVQQAGTKTPTATGTSIEASTAAQSSVGKFAGLRAAPLATCSGSTVAQWNFDASSITPSTGAGTIAFQPGITGPVTPYPAGNPATGFALAFTNWPTSSSFNPAYYLEFDVSTQGRKPISLSFDYKSETGGPTKLDVYYSATGGANYSYAFTSDLTLVPPDSWSTAPLLFDFSTQSTLDDNPNARFRLYAYSASDPSKKLNLDNITISGACLPPTPGPTPVPRFGDVIINEVAWAGTLSSAQDQWIELYNRTAEDINLSDWTLRGPSGKIGTLTNGEGVLVLTGTISAGGYYVIARAAGVFSDIATLLPALPPVMEDPNLALDACSDCGNSLRLYSPAPSFIDSANSTNLKWPAGQSSTRASMERYRSTLQDSPNAWVTFVGPVPTGEKVIHDAGVGGPHDIQGTPGQANWASTVTVTPSPIPTATTYKKPKPPVPTPFAHMLINEFLPRAGTDWNHDGAVNVYDEFIEVKNLGPISVNLSSWRLDDAANPPDSYTLPSMTLKSGERALFYRSTTQIPLADSGGTVRLINPSGVIFDARSYGPVASPDVSHCRIPDGFYWQLACFPTPGNENSLTGPAAVPPPIAFAPPPPCLVPDTAPDAFRLGECAPYGAGLWNRKYWDDQAGTRFFLVQDIYSKWKTIVK